MAQGTGSPRRRRHCADVVDGLFSVEFGERSLAEASALVIVEHQEFLSRCGWDLAFWMVRDESAVEDAIVLVGRRAQPRSPRAGWEALRVRLEAVNPKGEPAGGTTDGEALARKAGWVYVVGSHFGSDRRGLQAKRAFVARFRECDVDIDARASPAVMEVVKDEFRLHRLVNDALHASGVLPSRTTTLGRQLERGRKAYIETTQEHAQGKSWAELISEHDWPINIEGATFHPDGSLILGLRFPVASGGHPVLAQIDGVERLFANGVPAVREVVVLDDLGSEGKPIGIRDVEATDESIHVLVGNVDKEMFDDYTEKPRFAHWQTEVTSLGRDCAPRMTRVREFPKELGRVEGLTVGPSGDMFYACDDESGVRVLFERDDSRPSRAEEAQMADSDEHELQRMNKSIALWEQERDEDSIKELDRVLSADLLFRRASKTVVGKADFMAGLSGAEPVSRNANPRTSRWRFWETAP